MVLWFCLLCTRITCEHVHVHVFEFVHVIEFWISTRITCELVNVFELECHLTSHWIHTLGIPTHASGSS